jgi:thiol-disulfide isomerase/thioredoxin
MIASAQDLSRIQMNDVDGKPFLFKEHLDNDATIVSFWATWCLPCKKEMPALQALKDKYPDKKIEIISISKDSPRSLAKVRSFVKSNNYNFVFLVDPDGTVSSDLLVNDIPFTMLLDKQGKVIFSHSGYKKGDEAELEKELLKYWESKK